MNSRQMEKTFEVAAEQYAALGVDVETALVELENIALSIHCWQGDDVGGFEANDNVLAGGGIVVTGGYPGRARTLTELRADLETALALLPGRHRINLHAIYGDFAGKRVERNALEPRHFQSWVDWARELGIGLDFNPTPFSHPLAADGFTLSHRDKNIRAYWIEHIQCCRGIAAWIGKKLRTPCIHNLWIPDGSKDLTVDRALHRQLLLESLEKIFATAYSRKQLKDAVESKLFGIGSEAFVVGSHEFYLLWAAKHETMLCLDMGHFHPTESVADKVSAILPFVDELLFHVSRGIRWDSDHVVIFNDELRMLMEEIVRAKALPRVTFALDFFDASINRVGAYVIGARATLKALLAALLEPTEKLRAYEADGNNFARLALLEECKTLPLGAVWDYYCLQQDVPIGTAAIDAVMEYEKRVLAKRV